MLYRECPGECSCHLANLVRNPEGELIPVTEIDCSHRRLKNMPNNLPNITTILKLNRNNVCTFSIIFVARSEMQIEKLVCQ